MENKNDKKEIKIKEDYIKLSSFIKLSGISQTGGQAKELIKTGQIKVNNQECTQRGKKLYPEDEIEYNSKKFKVSKL